MRWDNGVLRGLGQALTAVLVATLLVLVPNSKHLPSAAASDSSGQCPQSYTTVSGTGSVALTYSGGLCYVAFKNLGPLNSQVTFSWEAPQSPYADILVVGGGGGAGNFSGGGAGELVQRLSTTLAVGSVTVVVGSGGSPGGGNSTNNSIVYSSNGQPSAFDSVFAEGGGGGAHYDSLAVNRTGASGGGGASSTTAAKNAGGVSLDDGDPNSFGNSGGNGLRSPQPIGGGGGGAGEPGQDATVTNINQYSMKGGDGLPWAPLPASVAQALGIGHVLEPSVFFAGGGGGWYGNSGQPVSFAGGKGGGGSGASSGAGDAQAHTGGGGGGSNTFAGLGGDGGSGVVLVRYAPISSIDQAITLTSFRQATGSSVIPRLTSDNFSMEAWVYPTDLSGWKILLNQTTSISDGFERTFIGALDGEIQFGVNGGAFVDTNVVLTTDRWQHVAMTVNGSVIKVFLDGFEVHSSSGYSRVGTAGSAFHLGGSHVSNEYWVGSIDQVKIWPAALSQSDIETSMHTYSSSGIAHSLSAHFDFNSVTTGLELDRSGNGRHLTLAGSVSATQYTSSQIVETGSANVTDRFIRFKRSYLTEKGGWTPPAEISNAELLVVGGGGGGSGNTSLDNFATSAGAGGGGGVFQSSRVGLTSPSVVKVGVGGLGGISVTSRAGASGFRGQSSAFRSLTAGGGGAGGCEAQGASSGAACLTYETSGGDGTAAGSGGSPSNFLNAYSPGFAGSATSTVMDGVTYAAVLGNRGGYYSDGGDSTPYSSGSGGGAGGAGSRNAPGAGLNSTISGIAVSYGGGAASWNSSSWSDAPPIDNRGTGGNGAFSTSAAAGYAGSSGVVILRYSLAPDAPTSLTATQSTSHATVNLRWTAPSYTGNSSISDYDIEYRPEGGTWASYSDGVATATTAAIELPQQCISYEFRVIAKNASYNSAASVTVSATPVWGTFGSLTGVQFSSTNSECVVKFTSTASSIAWTPPIGIDKVRALVVGGGGGGGAWVGAGGGAGGFTESANVYVFGKVLSIQVGSGGSGGSRLSDVSTAATNGQPSTISALGETVISVAGGGRGAGWSPGQSPGSGGSGGGGNGSGSADNNWAGATGIAGQGYQGGNGQPNTQWATGGGGGAGGPGGLGSGYFAGDGGVGVQSSITGLSTYYAGGGGGGYHGNNAGSPVYYSIANGADSNSAGTGGLGGGGDGGQPTGYSTVETVYGGNGLSGTGGGGGGAGKAGNLTSIGGNGGSGIVILRQLAVASPEFASQPQSASAEPGQTKTLSVSATGNGTLSYQWQFSTNGTSWTSVGTNSSSFTTAALTLADDGIQYRVVVTNTLNGQTSSLTSNIATISVTGVTITAGACSAMVGSDNGVTISETANGACLVEYATTGNNTFFVPNLVSSIQAFIVGGGGGGGGAKLGQGGGGGGGGAASRIVTLAVTTSQVIPVTIGSGGAGGAANSNGQNGSATSVSTSYSVPGGAGGKAPTSWPGGAGEGGVGAYATWASSGGSGGAGATDPGDRSYYQPKFGNAGSSRTFAGEFWCVGGGGGGGNREVSNDAYFQWEPRSQYCSDGVAKSGGSGGWHNGTTNILPTSGDANRGGGGGGGSYNSATNTVRAGASGADGIVAIYYVSSTGVISLSSIAAVSYSGTTHAITLTKENTSTDVTWTASNTAVCTVSGDETSATVTEVAGGLCEVSVVVAASSPYARGTSATSFQIDKITRTAPTWTNNSLSVPYGGTIDLRPRLSSPGSNAYTFSNSGTVGSCSVTGYTLNVGNVGDTCNVRPTLVGDAIYLDVDGTQLLSVTVTKIYQSALVITSGTTMNVNQTLTVSAAGGSGDGALSYHVESAGLTGCTIHPSTGVLAATAAGDCEVYAKRATSTNYDQVTSSHVVVTINKVAQNLSWVSQPQAQYLPGNVYSLEATASSQLSVAYSISAGLCQIENGNDVRFTGSGDCVILAGQSGSDSYLEAVTISQTVSVGKINQAMTISALANKSWGSLAFSLSATASSGLTIAYSESTQTTNDACDVSGTGIVTIKNVGTCAITATQAGNAAYTSVATTRLFEVTANQAGAPFIGSVSFGDRQLNAFFFTPSYLGGGTISAYELRAYELDGTLASTNTGCVAGSGATQSCSVIGLDNGKKYVLKVAAITQAGLGEISASSSEIIPAANPEAVGNLIAIEGNGTLSLQWSAPTSLGGGSFDQYRIFWRAPGEAYQSNGSPGGTVGSQASTSFIINGLQNGVAYDVKISTVTSINTLELQSNTAEVRQTPFTVPDAPASVAAFDNDGNVLISWQQPVFDGGNPIGGYVVTKDGTAVCTITSASSTSCEVSRPAAGTSTIEVVAQNDAGSSQPAQTSFTLAAIQNSVGVGNGGGVSTGNGSGGVASLPGVTPVTVKPGVTKVSGSAKVEINSTVKLLGSNMRLVTEVEVDGIKASFFINSDNMITVRIPIGVEPGDVVLTLRGTFGSVVVNNIFEVLSANDLKDSKVTIGTFLGYAAVYTKNLKEQRLSMKIGNKWRVVPNLSKDYTYNLTKIGKGKVVTVMVYVDRKLVSVKQVTVR